MQPDLFGAVEVLPPGFLFRQDFIDEREEAELLEAIRALPLEEAKYKQYTARRRTHSYGSQYDFSANVMLPAPGIPSWLHPLRSTVARWAKVPAERFVHALVSEYRPGAPLGWHRDVPEFDLIAGVSLGGQAVMRLRPYRLEGPNSRKDVISLTLEPRSAYLMHGEARWGWQHSIAAVRELRYSITFRTARATHA